MTRKTRLFLGALLLCLAGGASAVDASVKISVDSAPASVAASAAPAASAASAAHDDEDDEVGQAADKLRHHGLHLHGTVHGNGGDRTLVGVAHNQSLAAGHHADNVIGVMGNTTVAGDVSQDVVSVLGNVRVTGPVEGDVVGVLGNVYVNSRVDGDVVAVLGKVELGPDAVIGGEVNTVGGTVSRDGAAVVGKSDDSGAVGDAGDITGTQLDFADIGGADFTWLHDWVTQCFFKGRLLAFAPGFTWAWIVALVSLAFYVLTAVLLRNPVIRYTRVLEDHPAESLFAGFLSLLATPVLMVLLCITVIGILALPFLGIALLFAASFGKAVVFAWIGGRILRPGADGAPRHPALTVLVGGLVVTVLYAIPVVGMLTFQVTGLVGMGVAVYGLLLALRQKRQLASPPPAAVAGVAPVAAAAAASAAAVMPGAVAADAATATAPVAPVATISAGTAATYPRAGFWIRMFALFIDLVLVGLIAGLILDSDKTHLVLLAIYGAVMWKLRGATLGNMICHLHVVRLDGRPLDWPTAVIRALSCFLSLFVVCLGFIWIAVDPERQAWHDKIAGTVVVRLPKGVSLV
jgi:uncharacterized RDD family membrane protein YckC